MKAQSHPGASGLGGTPRYGWGISSWDSAGGAFSAAMRSMVVLPAEAAMAMVSRYANFRLSEQIERAYLQATQARDCVRATAAFSQSCLPAGPARAALLATLARNEAEAEALMRAVLRFGRDYGHLAFAFPVERGSAARAALQ